MENHADFSTLMKEFISDMIAETAPNSPEFKGKAGVFLGRFQTPGGHAAHFLNIARMQAENEHCLVLIGSAEKSGEPRNPFTAEARMLVLQEALEEAGWPWGHRRRLNISLLRDMSTEDDNSEAWGWYLWANAIARLPAGTTNFRFYYSDDISTVRSWFRPRFLKERVKICQLYRKDVLGGLSATRIREAMASRSLEGEAYLRRYCPVAMLRRLETFRPQLLEAQGRG